jgi:hypothetical protein
VDARVGLDFGPNIDGRLCPGRKEKKSPRIVGYSNCRTIPSKSEIRQIFRSSLPRNYLTGVASASNTLIDAHELEDCKKRRALRRRRSNVRLLLKR